MREEQPSGSGPGGSGRLLLAASSVLLTLVGAFFFLPLLFVAPAPLAALVYRYGFRTGIVTAVFTLIVIGSGQQRIFGAAAAFIDEMSWQALSLVAMTVLVTVGLIGIILGGAWREGASRWQALWLGVAGALLPMAAVTIMFWLGRGVDLLQLVLDAWIAMMRGLVEQSVTGGLAPETAEGLRDMIAQSEQAFPYLKPMFPGIAFVGTLVAIYLNGALAAWVVSREEPHPPPFPPFVTWRFPWPFALAFILGHGLLLVGRLNDHGLTTDVGQNLLMAAGFVFAVQGVAILVHAFERRGTGIVIRTIVVLALLWWWPAVLTWFGVLDTWFRFRTRVPSGGAQGGSD